MITDVWERGEGDYPFPPRRWIVVINQQKSAVISNQSNYRAIELSGDRAIKNKDQASKINDPDL